MRTSILLLFVMSFFTTALFWGCGEDEGVTPDPEPEVQTAQVMVIHAVPATLPVDVLLNDNQEATISYLENTDYVTVDLESSDTLNVKVRAAGGSSDLINGNVPLTNGGNYTIVAGGDIAEVTAFVFEDDLTAPAEGKAHIRFVHASPDAPAVALQTAADVPLSPSLSFGESSTFASVDAGTFDLKVVDASTASTALNVSGVVLETGKIYTVYARGYVNPSNLAPELGATIVTNN